MLKMLSFKIPERPEGIRLYKWEYWSTEISEIGTGKDKNERNTNQFSSSSRK